MSTNLDCNKQEIINMLDEIEIYQNKLKREELVFLWRVARIIAKDQTVSPEYRDILIKLYNGIKERTNVLSWNMLNVSYI